MKPPDEVKREFVRPWMGKGLADLTAAGHLLIGEAAVLTCMRRGAPVSG